MHSISVRYGNSCSITLSGVMTKLAQLRQFTFQLAEEVQQGLQHVIPVAELAPNFLSIFRRPPPKIAHECSPHRVDVSEPASIRRVEAIHPYPPTRAVPFAVAPFR